MLPVTPAAVPWSDVAAQLRPFVARRVDASEVDDVLQDVLIRTQRGLAGLRDEERLSAWLLQVARSAIADHGRARARHPIADPDATPEPIAEPTDADADRAAFQALAGCVAGFVARLPSPYREAITLVELEGLTIRAAADLAGVSASGMKSRVQRGREKLRALFERCCEIALDARGKVTDVTPRACGAGC
ncbi:MAG: sigma-70 family RNA polymerase sigma factor [Myxococcales bacterium]|nr:sigma-70 family RNA polymerase sigma factor [Myxococcales bacterium]